MSINIIIISFLILIFILAVAAYVKIELVERVSQRALNRILEIGLMEGNGAYQDLITKYNPAGNFIKNFLHPFRWTYTQMFKGL